MEDREQIIQEEDKELYENYRIVVDKGQGFLRIDKFLMTRIENVSRNKIQKAAQNECIKVNGQTVKPNYKVKPNDIIPQNIPLDVVYEDEDVIIINKQAGMVVHPAYGNYDKTLMNALMFHFQGQKNKQGEDVLPYMVHRIDKNTSGLLVFAKNETAQTNLAKQFFYHTVKRTYTALVWGDIEQEE